MNMLNQNTIKVFKSMSGIYQDHYPVSPQHLLLQSIMQLSGCCCYRLQLCSEKPAIAISLLLLLLHCTNQHCSWSKCLLLQELMSRMFLVNIPLMFAAVWRVLQMFVDDRVKAKIRFLRKADFHILHEFVDRDSLPESLGGKAKEKLLSDKQGRLACMLLTPFGIGSTASPLSPVDQLHWHCFCWLVCLHDSLLSFQTGTYACMPFCTCLQCSCMYSSACTAQATNCCTKVLVQALQTKHLCPNQSGIIAFCSRRNVMSHTVQNPG